VPERGSQQEDHFDLLPFIAILLCVLGTELLVTMSMATISLGVGVGEGWIATRDPTRPTKNPVLIEWDGQTAVIHRRGGRESLAVSFQGNDTPPELRPLLEEMSKRRATDYALFAVRPTGFENYYRLASEFKDRQVDVGYEPIEQGKSVRLVREEEK
jgi:hypothetical protein